MATRGGSPRRLIVGFVAAIATVVLAALVLIREGVRSIFGLHSHEPGIPPDAPRGPVDPRAAAAQNPEIAGGSAPRLGTPAPDGVRQRTRREFLTVVSIGMGGLAAMLVTVPVIGAILAPLIRPQPPVWRTVGNVDDFEVGTTTAVTFEDPSPLAWAGVGAQTAAWLRRLSSDQFEAFAINCTHLGCPVRWIPNAELFMCPCHGGVFYSDGSVAAGPPLKPLSLYPVRTLNGQVQVQASAVPIV